MAHLLRRSLCSLRSCHQRGLQPGLRFCVASFSSTFKYDDLEIQQCSQNQLKPKPDPEKLLFGHEFSDHMLSVEWTADDGWGRPLIHPLTNFSIHPAAKVFHYAVELYEGLKGYRSHDNQIRIFRPDKNMERMQLTAERAALPSFQSEELVKCLKKLVSVDQEWVPYHPTSTLYIRPTMIGTEASLGVAKTNRALLYVLTGPVGPYYPTGFQPVSLLADPKHVRAAPGGVGRYKMGSNYAPTIYVQIEALQKHNCQQVLWLYGDDPLVTEVGTMNFFMFWVNEQGEKELITPCLDSGLILPGVTRMSLVELASSWGEFKVTERDLHMREVVHALRENRVKEIFGAGTACVVCPVEKIIYDGEHLEIPTMTDGAPMTMRLYKELTDIQYGRTPSDWSVAVD